MPIVRVSGVPGDVHPSVITELRRTIQEAIASKKEFGLGPEQSTVIFNAPHPCDHEKSTTLIVEIAGLFRDIAEWPERTAKARQVLTQIIADEVNQLFVRFLSNGYLSKIAHITHIEVLEWPFDTTRRWPGDMRALPNRQGYTHQPVKLD